jgi:hypothetical protein
MVPAELGVFLLVQVQTEADMVQGLGDGFKEHGLF